MIEEPKEQREDEAEDQAGDDGEVESGVLAAMNDVAGKTAEPEREFATKIKKGAHKHKKSSENNNNAAEFAQWVHGESL